MWYVSVFMQLALKVRPTKMLPALRAKVAVTKVLLEGCAKLALTLAPGQPPGVSSMAVSFLQPPSFDFDFVPFGLPIGELGFVLDILKVSLLSQPFFEQNKYHFMCLHVLCGAVTMQTIVIRKSPR